MSGRTVTKARYALGWIVTPLHLIAFGTALALFHPLQMAARALGYEAHKRVVDGLNWAILASLRLAGARIECRIPALPADRPLLVVANHQSLYDIPLLGWVLRDHHPKYVAKRELARGLPSVSYNLRHGGSVLIDREDPKQALPAMMRFGGYIEEHRYAACVFPEGTRARDGELRPFQSAGLRQLLRAMPSALVVPVAIEGSWELVRYGMRPIPFGVRLRCTVLEPLEPSAVPPKELARTLEERLRAALSAPGGC